MGEKAGISDSQFHMWRAVFAFAIVDKILSVEEQELLHSYSSQVPFSHTQKKILENDFKKPQDVVAMYRQITDSEDKKKFCHLARALAWCEGDIDLQEERVLKHVSCFAHNPDKEIFENSRGHPHVHDYYQYYAKGGVAGLFKTPPAVELRV